MGKAFKPQLVGCVVNIMKNNYWGIVLLLNCWDRDGLDTALVVQSSIDFTEKLMKVIIVIRRVFTCA